MFIPLLILSPLAIMWLLALWHHPPARRQARILARDLWAPLLQALTKPKGKQRDAFAQFFAGTAIASSVGAASIAFETPADQAAWAWYLKLVALIVVLLLTLALASYCYPRRRGVWRQGGLNGIRNRRHVWLLRRRGRLRPIRRQQHRKGRPKEAA
ncbi:hypothetical protein [Achromobacter marplatensis]|uniref:hypothetical protein n=1 Tax=Achromobacter marplatensis TaxID=470868 RepID=UPI00103A8EBB|nr:hypothetical protein [Achromobacter marplatensis]